MTESCLVESRLYRFTTASCLAFQPSLVLGVVLTIEPVATVFLGVLETVFLVVDEIDFVAFFAPEERTTLRPPPDRF